MTSKIFKRISEFLNKFLEYKDETLFSIDGTYIKNGEMYKVSMLRG